MTTKIKQRVLQLIREYCPSARILELHPLYSEKALKEADAWLEMPTNTREELADQVNALARKDAAS